MKFIAIKERIFNEKDLRLIFRGLAMALKTVRKFQTILQKLQTILLKAKIVPPAKTRAKKALKVLLTENIKKSFPKRFKA